MKNSILAFLVCFALTLALSPLVFWLAKKLKAKQTILKYVEEHKGKAGTATMGGIMFIVSIIFGFLIFLKIDNTLAVLSLLIFLSFGILGFLDDFIKVHFKQNMGLRPYQKIIGQVGIALIFSLFCYYSDFVGSSLYVPFFDVFVDFGIFIIPFNVFVFLAITNSMNLLDGLDGLASSTSVPMFAFFGVFLNLFPFFAEGQAMFAENSALSLLSFCACGGLVGFLLFNVFPAKIFMGDTGSLALGGLLSAICIFSRLTLFVPLVCAVLVITSISDIIQVLHYKRTKKRVFLMAPLHHHFQMKGLHENKIVFSYFVITLLLCAFTIFVSL